MKHAIAQGMSVPMVPYECRIPNNLSGVDMHKIIEVIDESFRRDFT